MIDEQKQREIRRLYLRGVSISQISRDLGLNRRTAHRYARAGATNIGRISIYRPHIDRRLASGERSVSVLFHEVSALGFHGHRATISRYVKKWLSRSHDELSSPSVTTTPGREEELSRLVAWTNEMLQQQPIAAVVFGGEGSGKSYLVDGWMSMLSHQFPDIQTIQSRCWSHYKPTSFGVFVSVVRTFFSLESAHDIREQIDLFEARIALLREKIFLSTEDVQHLADILGFSSNSDRSSGVTAWFDAQAQAISRLLIGCARHLSPLAIVIDDAHWMDDAAMKLLEEIIRNWDNAHIMIMLVGHENFLDRLSFRVRRRPGYRQLRLGPLPDEAIPTLVLQRFPHAQKVDRDLLRFINEQTRGNALHLDELLRLLEHEVFVVEGDNGLRLIPGSEEKIPNRLHHLLVHRATRLSSELKRICLAASVMGRNFNTRMLLHFVDYDGNLRQNILSLQAEGYFSTPAHPEKGPELSDDVVLHPLQADMFYRRIARPIRRYYHAQVADALSKQSADHQSTDVLSTIAYHERRAGRFENALKAYVAAGDAESHAGSPACIALFRDALRLVELRMDDLESLVAALVRLASVYIRFGRVTEVFPLLRNHLQAIDLLHGDLRIEHLWIHYCLKIDLHYQMGDREDQILKTVGEAQKLQIPPFGPRLSLLAGTLEMPTSKQASHEWLGGRHLSGSWLYSYYTGAEGNTFWKTYARVVLSKSSWHQVPPFHYTLFNRAVKVNKSIESGLLPDNAMPMECLCFVMHLWVKDAFLSFPEKRSLIMFLIRDSPRLSVTDRAAIGLALKFFLVLPEFEGESERILQEVIQETLSWPTRHLWSHFSGMSMLFDIQKDSEFEKHAIHYIHSRFLVLGLWSPLWIWYKNKNDLSLLSSI